jgi:hypothetical protein
MGLFLQVMLIRWVGTEIRIFAYLQNTILVLCFLGLGLGCFHCRRPIHLAWTFAPLILLFGLLAFPLSKQLLQDVPEWLGPIAHSLAWVDVGESSLWDRGGKLALGIAIVFALMVLVCLCFVPLGQLLGRIMNDHPRIIVAYSVNILGSLIGVWLLAAFSWFYLPPPVWVGFFLLLSAPFLVGPLRPREISLAAVLALVAGFAGSERGNLAVYWSSYQKLALEPVIMDWEQVLWVKVNNTGYQQMIDRRPETTGRHPNAFPPPATGPHAV